MLFPLPATADSLKAAGAAPAGWDACGKCHDAPVREFKASVHGKALADKGVRHARKLDQILTRENRASCNSILYSVRS